MVNEDDGNREVIQGMLEESIPVADKVIDPPWADEDELEPVRRQPGGDARLRGDLPRRAG